MTTNQEVLDAVVRVLMQPRATTNMSGDRRYAEAEALAEAGLLVDELPPEPLPVYQVRQEPDTKDTWQRISGADAWYCAHPDISIVLRDYEVRDWPILVHESDLDEARQRRMDAEAMLMRMESDLDDLRAERDRLAARVAELEAVEGCAVDADALARAIKEAHRRWGEDLEDYRPFFPWVLADAIREHLPTATRPALPEGHVAVDLRDMPRGSLDLWAAADTEGGGIALYSIMKRVSQAELARRAAEGGDQS